MIIVFATLAAMALATFSGGRFRRFASLELRSIWVIWTVIAIQTFIFELPSTFVSDTVLEMVHLLTYVMSFGFLWLNRHIPGGLIIGLGAAANAAAITANGGVMPASPTAWRISGMQAAAQGEFANSNLTHDANLAFLGDIFAIPASWPLSNVFSIGDVVIVVGGAYFAYVWSRRPATSNAWPAPTPQSQANASQPVPV